VRHDKVATSTGNLAAGFCSPEEKNGGGAGI
jgi:hypothetical protein